MEQSNQWNVMNITRSELNLRVTLQCGQSFRWKETTTSDEWIGVIKSSIVHLKQTDEGIHHKFFPIMSKEESETILRDYFQLGYTLSPMYNDWGAPEHSINKQFKTSASWLKGVRVMRQDIHECLYSFICSSNNNIGRITKMVDSLCESYGTLIGEIEGKKYYSFPTISQLSNADEAALRESGFGYRAKFIVHTTKQLQEHPTDWLANLRLASREDAQKSLTSLMGVGQKVADCVSLFSLDKLDVVPVDTHIWAVAQKHMPSLKGKSLTTALYKDIGEFFKARFGVNAGWAHTVLFAAELPLFKDLETKPKLVHKPEPEENTANKKRRVRKAR